MSKYLKTAAEAGQLIQSIVRRNETLNAEDLADLVRLYNLGIKTAPRPVQRTVRLRACREAAKGLPLSVDLAERYDHRTGQAYQAVNIEALSLPGTVQTEEKESGKEEDVENDN